MADDSSDFFGKLDAKLNDQTAIKVANEDRANELRIFASEVFERVTPIAQDYASKLKDKGITAVVSSYATGIDFKLTFQDGGHYNLSLGIGRSGRTLEFEGDYTNDDGRPYRSVDGASYAEETWRDEVFIDKLQHHIEDYVFYSDRHRGVA